ncbi:MAG: efflux RND transporter periplasmic adaptor subunit [Fimbriimonas sp.]
MKARQWIGIIVSLSILIGIGAWRINQKRQNEGELKGASKSRTPVVEAYVAGPAKIESIIQSVVSLESPNRVTLSPRTSGNLIQLDLRVGDRVKAGQVVFRMDPTLAKNAVLEAQAQVAQAKARLAQAKIQQSPNTTSVAGQIDQQQASVSTAQADFNQAKKNLDSLISNAEAQAADWNSRVRAAKTNLENTQAVLEREEASLKNAKTRFSRLEGLFEKGFASTQQLDDSRTAMEVQAKAVIVAQGQIRAASEALDSAKQQQQIAVNNISVVKRQAEANITAARARLDQANSQLKIANSNTAQNPAYTENLVALSSAVSIAVAQLAQAQELLFQTEIRAPFDGTITGRKVDPGSNLTAGQEVVELQTTDWLFGTTNFPIEFSKDIKVGTPATILIDGLSSEVGKGEITASINSLNIAADQGTRQFTARVKLQNPSMSLRPGMFGTIKIASQTVMARVAVPQESIKKSKGSNTVAVIGKDNKVSIRSVTTGATDGKYVEIVEGLMPLERIVSLSYQSMKDGQEVKIPGDKKESSKGKSDKSAPQSGKSELK